MTEGYIKLYRQSINNPIFQKPLVWHYWEYCLLKANYKSKRIIWNKKEIIIERGSFITGRKQAAKETGLSQQNIRTAIETLKNLGMIKKSTIKSTSKFSHITVCNYDFYQSHDIQTNQQTNQQLTSKQPATNQQLTTNNNDNNDNNDKNIPRDNLLEKKDNIQTRENSPPIAPPSENDIFKKIINYLNEKLNASYRVSVKTKSLINARLNENFTYEDFKKVIDNKHFDWWGTDMQMYLRPITLFSNKFESYLQQRRKTNKISSVGLKNIMTGLEWAAEKEEKEKYGK